MNKILKLFKSNKLHWFEVRFVYNKKGNRIFDFVCQVGLKNKNQCLNSRFIKKKLYPLHKQIKIDNKYLSNGHLNVEILSYLGKFKK